MKRILTILILMFLSFAGTTESNNKMRFSGNVGIFYSSLSPYGEWIEVDFGYAWRPLRVNHQWRPYLHGRWIWTDYGWYWASSEPFGWATFHYGRWTYDDYYGWIWIPDDVWGPSWVEWRYDNDYIGWAPLSPYARFTVNVGIVLSNTWSSPVHYWNFVPCRQFTKTRINEYVEPRERTRRIFGNTRGTVNIRSEKDRVINAGIDTRIIERRGNVRINRVQVVDHDREGADRVVGDANRVRVETYRPKIDIETRATMPSTPDVRRSDRVTNTDRSERSYGTNRTEVYKKRSDDRGDNSNRNFEQRKESNNNRTQRESAIERRQQDRNVYEQQRSKQQEQREVQKQESYRNREQQQQSKERSGSINNRGNQRSEGQRDQGRTQQQGERRAKGRRPG